MNSVGSTFNADALLKPSHLQATSSWSQPTFFLPGILITASSGFTASGTVLHFPQQSSQSNPLKMQVSCHSSAQNPSDGSPSQSKIKVLTTTSESHGMSPLWSYPVTHFSTLNPRSHLYLRLRCLCTPLVTCFSHRPCLTSSHFVTFSRKGFLWSLNLNCKKKKVPGLEFHS